MVFGRKKVVEEEEPVKEDPTAWMASSSAAEFLLLHSDEIKFMCMFGYALWHGAHVFAHANPSDPAAYKMAHLVLEVAGGAILVPMLLQAVPVPLAMDAFAMALVVSFVLHNSFPMLREIMELSTVLKAAMIVMFEIYRAFEVVEFTHLASHVIKPSQFGFAVFGPILCGALAGCGGSFFPFDKGLQPLHKGLQSSMKTALLGAAFFHLFLHSSWSDGVANAEEKAHVMVACFFVVYGLQQEINLIDLMKGPAKESHLKTE